MAKPSDPGVLSSTVDQLTARIVTAQKEADAAKQAKKTAKLAFRAAKQAWKEARRANKAAKQVVNELKAELSVWAMPDLGLKRASASRSTSGKGAKRSV
ncbi:MAG: hypothetical protein ABIZ04_08300 [Opitutus sp.]